MPFREILGQGRALARLRQAWTGGRLAQAYCFVGPPGVGKRQTALALAQAVNCLRPAGPADVRDACGECPACRKIAAGNHPDVALVTPEEKTVITIEQIRQVSTRAGLRPYEGATKVWILDPADQMQEPAANAFLKTLEEPTRQTLLVLLVASASALLPTIRSRCQEVPFGLLAEEDLRTILVRHGRDAEEAAAAAALAGGSAAAALALDPTQVRAFRARTVQEVWESLDSLLAALAAAERLGKDRASLEEALEILRAHTRDLALAKAGGGRLLPEDRRAEAERQAAALPLQAILAVDEAQAEARRALARNAHPRLTAERMLLKMRQALGVIKGTG
jgi:DNA polymerase-3 subunit delta'